MLLAEVPETHYLLVHTAIEWRLGHTGPLKLWAFDFDTITATSGNRPAINAIRRQ
jgi:hypothetical protein